MVLSLRNIKKSYNSQLILDNISFSLQMGKIVGLLGENGAGKSTLIKILCGVLHPSNGSILYNKKDIQRQLIKYKKMLGYLPENNPLYKDLYVKEYLLGVVKMYARKDSTLRLQQIILQLGLQNEAHKKIKTLSKGYQQRVGLAQALIHKPKIVVLDEPTSGMDPNQLIEVRNLLQTIKPNKIILFSSHNLNEVKTLCDRVLIMHNRKIVKDLQKNFETTDILEKTFFQFTAC